MIAFTIGMTEEQFWLTTPRTFEIACKAHDNRRKDERWMTAWLASNIMQMWVKKGTTITPDKLLGIKKPERLVLEKVTPAQFREELMRRGRAQYRDGEE